ncbi:6355_t:CDS:1, partial [Ambispora leptoticha]
MGEFLAKEISTIIEELGSDKFIAVVIDAASNCNLAHRKTQEMYLYIWNVRCAAHAINLIAAF